MKAYMNALSEHIKRNPATFDSPTDTPCLEALWWHYASFFPLHNDTTKEKHAELRKALSALKRIDADDIIDQIGSLCTEYEKIAFIAGLKLGAQLITEITQDAH